MADKPTRGGEIPLTVTINEGFNNLGRVRNLANKGLKQISERPTVSLGGENFPRRHRAKNALQRGVGALVWGGAEITRPNGPVGSDIRRHLTGPTTDGKAGGA